MTVVPHQLPPRAAPDDVLVPLVSRRLAAAGLGVQVSRKQDTCELTVIGVTAGKSLLEFQASWQARWYWEPAGPSASPAALASTIGYLLGASPNPASLAAYRNLPLKGQVGRSLQDQGLTVALRVSEDLDSFEATTDIDITSPARPWLGTIRLSDDAALDWHVNWHTAFQGNPAALIDVITPILRHR
ncbi:MAG: hypothetical protein JO016_10105 [Actinobacteria bacterium]|nr:hypothetical protein [Actinomycetota bacterium]